MLTSFRGLSRLVRTLPNSFLPSYQFSEEKRAGVIQPHTHSEEAGIELDDDVFVKGKGPNPPSKLRNAALVLSGSGVYDGSEVTEAVSFLIAFGKHNINFQCFAPDKEQSEVINHLKGEPQNEKRNVLVESARIARGNIKDLKELSHSEFDAVFFPGGFGAAKNLSNYATKGPELTVDPEVERVLRDFHANRKPIGLACISPVLAAKVFGESNKVALTVGNKGEGWPYGGTIEAIEKLGAKHNVKAVTSTNIDKKNLVFTVPAFMKDTKNFHDIYEGIEEMVTIVKEHLPKVREEAKERARLRKEKRDEKKNAAQ